MEKEGVPYLDKHCNVGKLTLVLLLTYLLTYLPTYLLTYSLAYLLQYLITCSLAHIFTYLLSLSLTHLLTNLLTYSLAYVLTYLLTHSLTTNCTLYCSGRYVFLQLGLPLKNLTCRPFLLCQGKSCQHWKDLGFVKSGIYNINPDEQDVITVYCDQMSDGGGWTVFQRRTAPFKLDFRRGWQDYENGFQDGLGLQKGELWLGLRNLHRVSLTVPTGAMLRMRIELQASGGHTGYATFDNFAITGPADNYRWSMTTYSGNIGNSIFGYSQKQWYQSGMQFTTYDRDHDTCPCLCGRGTGFWFNWCGHAHLNDPDKPHWNSWSHKLNVIGSAMMLR